MFPRLDEHLMTIAARQFKKIVKISGEQDMINGEGFDRGESKEGLFSAAGEAHVSAE